MVPQYSRSGRIYYTASEGRHSYLYRMKDDGSEDEKITSEPIDNAFGISPDERFVVVYRTLNSEENSVDAEAVPIGGGSWVRLCSGWCEANWTPDGKRMYFFWNSFTGNARTYVIPIPHGSDFPKLPNSGFQSEKELRTVANQVFEGALSPGPDSSSYAFSKGTARRNLYRVPLR